MKPSIKIDSPCSEKWYKMSGDKKVRHCSKCRFNVYNFKEMSEKEIEDLLKENDKVCVRLYMRQDGTYMTKDCQKKKRRKQFLAVASFVMLLPFSILLFTSNSYSDFERRVHKIPVIGKIIKSLTPRTTVIMGAKCPPTVPGTKTPATQNNPAQTSSE